VKKTVLYLNRIAFIFGFATIVSIIYQSTIRASHKLFWVDEALEIFHVCTEPLSATLINGAPGQCSPPPFYYLLQTLIVRSVAFTGESVLLSYRFISLAAAALCLALVLWFFSKKLGSAIGLLSLILLNGQPIFWHFSAENRPYMLWLFLFTALMFATVVLTIQHPAISRKLKIYFFIFAVLLTLVAGAGVVQLAGFCAVPFLWLALWKPKSRENVKTFKFLFATAFICLLIGLYYALHGCHSKSGEIWDLLQTRNYTLIKDVLALLWPTNRSPVTLLFNAFLLVGIASPFLLWKKRSICNEALRFSLALGFTAVIQLFVTVLLGFLVAYSHYFFIPRIFICLIILRTILVATGAWYCFEYIFSKNKWSNTQRAFLIVIVMLATGASVLKSRRSLDEFVAASQANWPKFEKTICQLNGGFRSQSVIHLDSLHEDTYLNLSMILAEESKDCLLTQNDGHETSFHLKESIIKNIYFFEISNERPTGDSIVIIPGKPVTQRSL
jgi:hypothetical protein